MEFSWVKDLAEQELKSENSNMRELHAPNSEAQLIEEGVISYLLELKEMFQKSVEYFNSYRPDASIKLFRINNTVADFMLFRNGLKLVIANTAPGVVTIYFMSPLGGVFGAGPSMTSPPIQGGHQLRAILGTFGDVKFLHQNSEIKTDYLVRHYLSTFIKMSSS